MMRQTWFIITFSLITVLCCFYQYQHTTPTDFRHLTEIESIEQLDRMNRYPSATFRLAHIIEARPESIVLSKLQSNFINIFDPNTLFHQFLWPILLPFFLYGLFKILDTKNYPLITIFFLPIILLTIIGHQTTVGPTALFPTIFICTLYGIYRLKN